MQPEHQKADSALQTLIAGQLPDISSLAALLKEEEDAPLLAAADRVRREQVGDLVHIRAIIEFSNTCRRACRYCGLRAQNTALPRYRMSIEEIAACAKQAAAAGYKTVVLQSGEDSAYTAAQLCRLIKEVKAAGLTVTLSVGERPYSELQAFYEAGAARYLLKHETADETLYRQLHPDSTLKARIECLRNIKRVGFETGGGFMVGLPNQTEEILAKDLLLLREVGCDMAGIGPFIPNPQTPLLNASGGSAEQTLRAVAAARLLLPRANLPATTSLGVADKRRRFLVFGAGANVIMKKVTPWRYRRDYEIYPADLGPVNDIESDRRQLERDIRALGREPY